MKVARTIYDFVKEHPKPPEVVVLGPGPSLKKYKRENHPDAYVIGMNDVVEHADVDGVTLFDRVTREIKVAPEVDKFVLEVYKREWDGQANVWATPKFGPSGGSLVRMITLLKLWGVNKLVIYGCDGAVNGNEGHAYERRFSSYTASYERSGKSAKELYETYKIGYEFIV